MTDHSPENSRPAASPTRIVGICVAIAAALFVIPWVAAAWSNGDDQVDAPAASRVVDGIATDTPDDLFPPQRDLEPGANCTVDTGGLRAAGSVTNHTSEPVRYRIEIEWENEGLVLDTASSFLDRVEPQATAEFEVISTDQGGTAASTCRVKTIDRSAL